MRKAAFIYKEALSRHVLREDHVLKPTRLQYTYELLDSYRAFEEPSSLLIPPKEATEEELLSFHTEEYVRAVKSFSRGEMIYSPAKFNFSDYGDNPISLGMYEAAALSVGGSLLAAELVSSGEMDVVFNVSGGLHHAAPNYASGFCVFNDPVIAIKSLLKMGMKVAYIDIDAHHGDGVQLAFYSTPQVLTISLHETGRFLFPGTGEVSEIGVGAGKGYAVNLPLAPYTDDEVYLWAFDQIVPPLVSSFAPDIVVTQLGCDSHFLDPLTHLNLTTEGYAEILKRLRKLAPKWVALGGGGYEMEVVPRCWTLAYGVMMDKDFPTEIPSSYQERYGLKKLRDEKKPSLDSHIKEQTRRFAENSVAEVERLIFPYHRL